MQNLNRDVKNKNYLMLCVLHDLGVHGKTEDSDPNIETHYLVYDRYHPNSLFDNLSIEEREFNSIISDIAYLNNIYLCHCSTSHPTIRNYVNIISRPNYIKAEIGEYIILPTQEAIAILKTFWLRIIQKKWKKVFQERKNIIKQRCYLSNLSIRTIRGRYPDYCVNLPGIRGMLSNLK